MDHHFLQFFFNENRGFSSKLNINFMEFTSFRLWAASPVAYVLLFRFSKCTKKVVFFSKYYNNIFLPNFAPLK